MPKNEKGFTLNEILLIGAVTAVLGIVASLLLIDARQKSRDSIRIADVSRIRDALEMYFYDCSRYPTKIATGEPITSAQDCGGNVHLKKVPLDPSGQHYYYLPCRNGKCEPGIAEPESYTLLFELEGGIGGVPAGRQAATPEKMY